MVWPLWNGRLNRHTPCRQHQARNSSSSGALSITFPATKTTDGGKPAGWPTINNEPTWQCDDSLQQQRFANRSLIISRNWKHLVMSLLHLDFAISCKTEEPISYLNPQPRPSKVLAVKTLHWLLRSSRWTAESNCQQLRYACHWCECNVHRVINIAIAAAKSVATWNAVKPGELSLLNLCKAGKPIWSSSFKWSPFFSEKCSSIWQRIRETGAGEEESESERFFCKMLSSKDVNGWL